MNNIMCDTKCGTGCGGGCTVSLVAKILLIIGGINWGLIGAALLMGKGMDEWNVVHMLLGAVPTVEAIVYVLVGVAAIASIFHCKCKKCMGACGCDAGSANKVM